MDLPNWLDWTGTRYFLATLAGFLVALAVEMAADAVANRRKLRFIREAIAEEVTWNLTVLDEQFAALLAIYRQPGGVLRIPRQRLLTPLMTQASDAETGSLLSTREWLLATNAMQQCDTVNSALHELRERLGELNAPADLHERAAFARSEAARIVNYLLPPLGHLLVDLLCQIMERQVEYSSTRMMRIAVTLMPARSGGCIPGDRVWRVRALPDLAQRTGVLIAWRDDRVDQLPADLHVIEIDPGPGGDRVRLHPPGRFERLASWPFRRSETRILRAQQAYLASTHAERTQQTAPLTEFYGDGE